MSAAIGVGAAFGIDGVFASPALASAPTSAGDVLAYARRYMGLTRDGIKANDFGGDFQVVAPWAGFTGPWCAWFVGWCLRGLGVVGGFNYGVAHNNATDWNALPSVSSGDRQPGDLVVFTWSDGHHHVGFISDVNAPVMQLDGNRWPHSEGLNDSTSYVREQAMSTSYVDVGYHRPAYTGGSGGNSNGDLDDAMTDLIYFTTSGTSYTTNGVKTPAVTVTANSMWYQERPGAPLFRLTDNYSGDLTYQGNLEYVGFYGARFANAAATRTPATPTQVGKLIELRGETLQPSASLAPLRTV